MNSLPQLTFLLLLYLRPDGVHAQGAPFDYPTANLSTKWTNSPTSPHTIAYPDGTNITAILLRQTVPPFYGPAFAFGFYCRDDCKRYYLSIYIIYVNSGAKITSPTNAIPQVIWSANRNRPVKPNSTLELTGDGDLLLKDSDGSLAWSTNTAGRKSAVVRLNLLGNGNLVLLDADDAVVWQSFDHPSDSLLSGQSIVEGQRLTANTSSWNLTRGELYISHTSGGFYAYADSNPPQVYHHFGSESIKLRSRIAPCFVSVTIKALTFIANSSSSRDPNVTLDNPPTSVVQFLRLESDGHLRLYEWDNRGWSSTADAIVPYLGECAFPMVCGRFGICSEGGQCRCPPSFSPVNSRQPELGCSPSSPLSCNSLEQHKLLEFEDVSYFNYAYEDSATPNYRTLGSCRKACLRNCSCKAAFFQYGSNASSGTCYLPKEVFSLMNNVGKLSHYNSTAFLKAQEEPPLSSPQNYGRSSSNKVPMIAGVTIGASVAVLLLILGISVLVYRRRRARKEEEEDEEVEAFLRSNGMPTRFSYEDLRSTTDNFASDRKLGSGGFGSVFRGELDGTRIAVKKLESARHGKKEFVAEVETIGNIHHLNLVRLIGFCVEKSYKLLVYEYMSNGSLDRWIFPKSGGCELSWETRRSIIRDVAKGLLYLHEECRQKIAHLDIKPQNILLDSNFNAKVADFGMAKLIDRDQSAVQTVVRGTRGYMAPEWYFSTMITEKVDIYSFGIVILETVCTRKNLDYSQPEESFHLLPLLKEKAKSGQLLDIILQRDRNVQNDAVEMVKMLKLAIWCLQYDVNRRPSMGMVVKILEGTKEMTDDDMSDGLADNPAQRITPELQVSAASSRLLESVLSGPR